MTLSDDDKHLLGCLASRSEGSERRQVHFSAIAAELKWEATRVRDTVARLEQEKLVMPFTARAGAPDAVTLTASGRAWIDLDFEEWITPRRGWILNALLDLRRLRVDAERWAAQRRADRAHAWNRLVGVAFALWRALPLIAKNEDELLDADAIRLDHAGVLLDELLLHNRVTYEQDRKTADWMVGFYLNCAEDRIHSTVADELREDLAGKPVPAAASRTSERAQHRSIRLTTPRRTRWADALNALTELTQLLSELANPATDPAA